MNRSPNYHTIIREIKIVIRIIANYKHRKWIKKKITTLRKDENLWTIVYNAFEIVKD